MAVGHLDTLLDYENHTDDHDISVAPGEGNYPISIFIDKQSEVLAFPTPYCGQAKVLARKIHVSYAIECKSELRRKDRRVASHVPNLFFKVKKLQMKQIIDKSNICLRKTKLKKRFTAKELKSSSALDTIIKFDDGYRVFKEIRGTPPYWEKAKRDIFAMIRQLGLPTWFASFSAAETKWEHLLKILGRTVRGKNYTSDDLKNLTWQDKTSLIREDPVTCARHFDYMVHHFIKDVLKSSLSPVGKLVDYFFKVEFQHRGSPHIHMLMWIENAPTLGGNTNEEIGNFVDRYVTCTKVVNDENLQELVERQEHKHSRTCKKKKKNATFCRFHFPQPPMRDTAILDPRR